MTFPAAAPAVIASLLGTDPSMQAYVEGGLLRLDEGGRAQVYFHVTEADTAALSELESKGAVIETTNDEGTLVQAWGPVNALEQLAAADYVTAVTLPKYGRVNVGAELTEGDALLGLASLRSARSVDGSGITVGVISDGIFGLADSVASGDLPTSNLVRDGAGKLVAANGGVIA